MKKERKFMLVIALLLTMLPLTGCGEKVKETEIKKYAEENYAEVSDETTDDYWKDVFKSYETPECLVEVRNVEEEGNYYFKITGYSYGDEESELGNEIWEYETKKFSDGEYIMSMLNPEDTNIIFVSEDNVLSALDASTGKIKWSNRYFENAATNLLVSDGKLFFMNDAQTEKILVIDYKTGEILKTLKFKKTNPGSTMLEMLIGDKLVISGDHGLVEEKTGYTLDINTGIIEKTEFVRSLDEPFYGYE